MWSWEQPTGKLRNNAGQIVDTGYSGKGEGKNNPAMQDVADVGPIPEGHYLISAPIDTPKHGPYVLRLTPANDNVMFGRAGFLIHGDNIEHPGSASEGCIILLRSTRERIWRSGDASIRVVKEFSFSS